jgi:hypothetical protein
MIGVAIAFAAGVLKNYALLATGIAVELLLFAIAHERRDKRLRARLRALSEENTALFLKLERKEREISELKQVISRLRERLKSFAASEDETLAKVILESGLREQR